MANKKNKPDQPKKMLAKKTKQSQKKAANKKQTKKKSQHPTPSSPAPPVTEDNQKFDGNKARPESPRSNQQFVPLTEEEVLLQNVLKKFNISKRELVGIIATGKLEIPKKKGRPKAIDEFKASNMLALALVGLRPATVARILGLEYRTVWNFLKKNPEFKEMFNSNRMSRFQHLMSKAWQQVNSGYWPAIEFMIKNFFGDFLKEQTKGIRPGEDDADVDGVNAGDIDHEIQVKVTKYKRKIDQKILEDIEDESGDEEAVKVDRMTPGELGEAVDATFEEENGEENEKEKEIPDKKSKAKGKRKNKKAKSSQSKEPISDYY